MTTTLVRILGIFGMAAVLLFSAPLQGAIYYVAPDGNDSNDCSAGAPCRQIRKPLALVIAGDSIQVADGAYLGFDIRGVNGQADNPITIIAQGSGAEVTPSTDRPDNRDTIFITRSSYVVIDGLQAYNANRAAVRIDDSRFITIRNGIFGNNDRWGIFTDFSDDLLLENNECYGSQREHGIYVSDSSQRPVLRGNLVHDNVASGIQLNADLSDGPPGLIRGAIIEGNVIYNNGERGGAAINLDGVQDSAVVNNLLVDNHATGIVNYQGDGAAGPRGIRIYHNTVVMAANGRHTLQFRSSTGPNQVRNNILYHPNAVRAGIELGDDNDRMNLDSDYNILDRISLDGTLYTLASWRTRYPNLELHSLSATPGDLFVDAAGGNFDLPASSPAVDAGQTLPEVTTDILGRDRPYGAASDIGAYEYTP